MFERDMITVSNFPVLFLSPSQALLILSLSRLSQNLIENVWHILKIKIGSKNVTTIQGLKSEITKAWSSLPEELALHLVQSMNKRISRLIEREGDYALLY